MRARFSLSFVAVVLQASGSLQQDSGCGSAASRYNFTCPANSSTAAICSGANGGASLAGPIIIRCDQGCPYSGNCNDNLAGAPPIVDKINSYCWQQGPGALNAQCTADCVDVTLTNGTVFYPMGCSFSVQNTTGPPKSTSIAGLSSPTPTAAGGGTPSAATTTPSPKTNDAADRFARVLVSTGGVAEALFVCAATGLLLWAA